MTEQTKAEKLADQSAHLCVKLRITPMPLANLIPHLQACADELRRLAPMERELENHKAAQAEWIEKTDWVQKATEPGELGMHRADALRQRIERLQAECRALKIAEKRERAARGMFVVRLEHGPIEMTADTVLGLLNDCDYLASCSEPADCSSPSDLDYCPPVPGVEEPVAQWQKRHPVRTENQWGNTDEFDAKWWRDNSKGWEIRALYTHPQPTSKLLTEGQGAYSDLVSDGGMDPRNKPEGTAGARFAERHHGIKE